MRRPRTLAATVILFISAQAQAQAQELTPSEPLQIVISLHEQRLAVFRGTRAIAESRVSSGRRGYSTPSGIYSILHKKKRHFSSIYDNAPMPFMQRLTWTGIALHGSNSVPSYPASHGCIRLPIGFDQELYSLTGVGAHVVINGNMLEPAEISHPVLPQPQAPRQFEAGVDQWRLRHAMGSTLTGNIAKTISTAAMLAPVRHRIGFESPADDPAPLRIMITRRTQRENNRDIQRLLNQHGYEAGTEDGIVGSKTRTAIREFQAENELPETGAVTPELVRALYRVAGEVMPLNGRLMVRHEFKPVFDAPISISNESQPLGTHLLTANNFDKAGGQTRWSALTLENRLSELSRALYGIDPEASEQVELRSVLNRISIPQVLREKLSQMLTPGSSIVIADNGSERYTGWKTDFVINTHIDRTRISAKRTGAIPSQTAVEHSRPRQAFNSNNLPGLWR